MNQATALPTLSSIYAAAGFQPRAKGQRYDKGLLVGLDLDLVQTNANSGAAPAPGCPAGSSVEELGEFNGFDGFGLSCVYTALVVTLANGTRVPAYRKYAPGHNYMVCQSYSWKATRA